MKRARKLHNEMMRTDPDYKAKWEAMQNALGDLLCDPELELKD